MASQVVTYCTTTPLECETCLPSDVVLCVPHVLTEDGFGFIEAALTELKKDTHCGVCRRTYTFEYDDAQLADPNIPLLSCEISNVFCKGCEFNYLSHIVNTYLTGWETDSEGNFIQSLGFSGHLLYNDGFQILANGFNDGSLTISGGLDDTINSGATLRLRGKNNLGSASLKGADVSTGHVDLALGHSSALVRVNNVADLNLWNFDASGNINADTTRGGNINLGCLGKTVNFKSGANGAAGTWLANGSTAVVIPNTLASINMVVVPSLQTAGGTPAGAPYISAINPGVSFSMKAAAGDTSVYNYVILNTF